MHKKEIVSMATLYAISPVHAGSGMSTGAVDLPIQRERHTNWPHIQASAVKGAMRAHFRDFAGNDLEAINQIFGSDAQDKKFEGSEEGDDTMPGSVSISDARLFAFPVRSNIAPFVMVTSPAVIKRLNNDLAMAGLEERIDIPDLNDENSAITINWESAPKKIILEDAVVQVDKSCKIPLLKEYINNFEQLLLISDTMFDYIVTNCTQIQTQIKIDHDKGTAEDGALRYEELLPSDTLLYTIVHYSRHSNEIQASMIQKYIEDNIKGFIQIGGDETLGRGIFQLNWISQKEDSK